MKDNFYKFTARSLQGKEISMDAYAGKVILVVNTASKCGSKGIPVKRFSSATKPEAIVKDIEKLLTEVLVHKK